MYTIGLNTWPPVIVFRPQLFLTNGRKFITHQWECYLWTLTSIAQSRNMCVDSHSK